MRAPKPPRETQRAEDERNVTDPSAVQSSEDLATSWDDEPVDSKLKILLLYLKHSSKHMAGPAAGRPESSIGGFTINVCFTTDSFFGSAL